MIQDLRFGFRMLRRSPGFSILAILCLTLGIGANTSVFSWIEGILLRPFPAVANQDRLFVLGGTARGASRVSAVSWPDFIDFQKNCTLAGAFIADRLVAPIDRLASTDILETEVPTASLSPRLS